MLSGASDTFKTTTKKPRSKMRDVIFTGLAMLGLFSLASTMILIIGFLNFLREERKEEKERLDSLIESLENHLKTENLE